MGQKNRFWIVASIALLVLMLPPRAATEELVAKALIALPWIHGHRSAAAIHHVSNQSLRAQHTRRPRHQEHALTPLLPFHTKGELKSRVLTSAPPPLQLL